MRSGCYTRGALHFFLDVPRRVLSFNSAQLPWAPPAAPGQFTITWPDAAWGTATFVLQADGASLLEKGEHLWQLEDALLSEEQRRALREAGALVLHAGSPCAPGRALAEAARGLPCIQAALEAARAAHLPPACRTWHTTELQGAAARELEGLVRPLWPAVCALLGMDPAAQPIPSYAQIAIKVGAGAGALALPGELGRDAHIDGLPGASSGVPRGEVHNHTLLLGIALTDQLAPNHGNLVIVPGSHAALARAAARTGLPRAMQLLCEPFEAPFGARLDALLEEGGVRGGMRGLAPPHALCLEAGSAVLAHYALVHATHPNTRGEAEPRIMVYWRVQSATRPGHARGRPELFAQPFLELPGLSCL